MPDAESQSGLLPQGAFVVQFRVGSGIEPSRCAGRVEHIASGRAMSFRSQEELWAFTMQILTDVQAKPPKPSDEAT
jgi:hypothetical protein